MTERRILFVHAHPDDESSKGAATAARYADEGASVVLVTCTAGEAGEVLNPGCPPVEPAEMSATRKRELEAAVAIIGFTGRYEFGYVDSGYHEDRTAVADTAFSRQPIDEPGAAFATILRQERPHVVVTYPPDGGYPHPDHIMCYEVTMRALELAEDAAADVAGEPWRVPKVYASHSFPPDRVLALHAALTERGLDSPFEGWPERQAQREADAIAAGRPVAGWPCDARVLVANWFDRRDRALLAHVTQIDPDGMWFGWPRDLEAELYPWECFTALRSDVATSSPEDDLFAGLGI